MSLNMNIYQSWVAFRRIEEHLGINPPKFTRDRHLDSLPQTNALFVSLDAHFDRNGVTQLGISTFDPQVLQNHTINQLVISDSYPILTTTYVIRRSQSGPLPAIHGQHQVVNKEQMHYILKQLMSTRHPNGTRRDVIIVSNYAVAEICAVENICGLDVSRLPNVKAIMDLQDISHGVLGMSQSRLLYDLVVALRLDYSALTLQACASRYALRVLLAMVYLSKESSCSRPMSCKMQLDAVNQIAMFSDRPTPALPSYDQIFPAGIDINGHSSTRRPIYTQSTESSDDFTTCPEPL